MIDKKTGNVQLTDSIVLKPKTNFELLNGLELGQVSELRDMGNGFKWLSIKNIHVKNEYFIISLCFQDELLNQISMIVKDEPFNLSPEWNSWSERKEKQALQKYRNWICKELGENLEFNWGRVWVNYHPKSGASSIEIRYK